MEKKVISVLGDSISTYIGYTPRRVEFYDGWVLQEADMTSVEDTWWMQVIRYMNGELGYNDSISGSTVIGHLRISATSAKRQRNLAINGIPDVIFLYMGSNDWAFSVLPEEFEREYNNMLFSLLALYPNTEIYCSTLLRGQDAPDPEERFLNVDACVSPEIYSQVIRRCVKNAGVHLIDVEKYHVEYATIDGIHPNKDGMATIASLWIKEIGSL